MSHFSEPQKDVLLTSVASIYIRLDLRGLTDLVSQAFEKDA